MASKDAAQDRASREPHLLRFSQLPKGTLVWVRDQDDVNTWKPGEVNGAVSGAVGNTLLSAQRVGLNPSGAVMPSDVVDKGKGAKLGGESIGITVEGTNDLRISDPHRVKLRNPRDLQNNLTNRVKDRDGTAAAEDLSTLCHLNEATVLEAIQSRFLIDKPYSRLGPVLLSVNPYKHLPRVAGSEVMKECIQRSLDNLQLLNSDKKKKAGAAAGTKNQHLGAFGYTSSGSAIPLEHAHIYSATSEAFLTMINAPNDATGAASGGATQTILISGESGSGKSVVMQHTLDCLARLTGNVMQPILPANVSTAAKARKLRPQIRDAMDGVQGVLNAFGGACTARNRNSSRFSQYLEMFYDDWEKHVGNEGAGVEGRAFFTPFFAAFKIWSLY